MRQHLIERARRGDTDAFGRLAAQEIDRLHAVARLILRDPQLAEDAVQETLIRCWRKLPGLRDVGVFDAWLYRILVRAAADQAAHRRRFRSNVQNLRLEPHVFDETSSVADRDELEQAFQQLSLDHRAVVVLHHYADLPLSQVAEVLGIKLGTAKSRYHYAMASLRASVEAAARLTPTEVVRL
ncbi:MAG: RNA polymerase sigma factor [Chloroflexota bacterium]|nr:RNA polymerase sigma factor [Chloroflexota bacterium]